VIKRLHYIQKAKQVSNLFEQVKRTIKQVYDYTSAFVFVLTQNYHQHQKRAKRFVSRNNNQTANPTFK
jgi:hypothetical protein